ncbi:hypothetical protein ACFPES_23305 [Paenibacillus sp. GCM10023248]|uniref:hypothetical protein n=1 Tax=Bacillales TaxID=1385 RepID=UPI0023795CD9|nr:MULTISPECIES: hypothetical protein [Bacillales]MDD9269988.1 hypothetical protein [Paenibacillus sp. MAHUQ-63]MDR6883210.1 hypothetical protein [Bacillus sp. 3255]
MPLPHPPHPHPHPEPHWTFESFLKGLIGRDIEVYFINQFYVGQLQSVEDGYFTMVVNSAYYLPEQSITVFSRSVEYLRILN